MKIKNAININILEHGYLFADTDWKHYNITSPFNRLYFMFDGECYIENEQEKVVLIPGKMYLIPLNKTYNYICEKSLEKFYIHFRAEFFSGIDIFQSVIKCIEMTFEADILQKLLVNARTNDFQSALALKTFLSEMIFRIFRGTDMKNSEKLESILRFQNVFGLIRDNCSAKLTAKEVSKYIGIPYAVLSKDFREAMGYSIKNLIDNMLIQAAKEKILLSGMSVKEIAFELKFSDEFYFSRYFKKHTGMCPKEYRIKNRIDNIKNAK